MDAALSSIYFVMHLEHLALVCYRPNFFNTMILRFNEGHYKKMNPMQITKIGTTKSSDRVYCRVSDGILRFMSETSFLRNNKPRLGRDVCTMHSCTPKRVGIR